MRIKTIRNYLTPQRLTHFTKEQQQQTSAGTDIGIKGKYRHFVYLFLILGGIHLDIHH